MPFNPDIQNRRSIRLREYDYAGPGAYFITICAFQRECMFGDVVDGEMRLNVCGEIVQEEWLHTPTMRPNVELDAYTIMPNHFHAIICLSDDVRAHYVRLGCVNGHGSRAKSGSVGSILAGFKSSVTKRINKLQDNSGKPVWQRNYYEHIIRNEDDLCNIRQYILNNPQKWSLDENNPLNVGADCVHPDDGT